MIPKSEHDERIFEGTKFALDMIPVQQRSGEQTTLPRITHPGAVTILPLLDANTIVLIRNKRYATGKTMWELPAGTRELNEDIKTCAARELEEETGYRAASIEPMIEFFTAPGFCDERIHAFIARDLSHVGQSLEPTEDIDVDLVPVQRVLEMIRTNEIEDAKTIAIVLYHLTYNR